MNSLKIEGLSQSIDMSKAIRKEIMPSADMGENGEAGDVSEAGGGKTFSQMLDKMLTQANQDQVDADRAIKEMVAGRNKNIHETMLAIERADLSLKLMMQVRNKVLDAYREVMRMQV